MPITGSSILVFYLYRCCWLWL